MTISEQQLQQEARRVLRRLAGPRQLLMARGAGRFAVTRGPAGLTASRVIVAGEVVAAFLTRNWIADDGPGRYVIAQAGLDFRARSLGGE